MTQGTNDLSSRVTDLSNRLDKVSDSLNEVNSRLYDVSNRLSKFEGAYDSLAKKDDLNGLLWKILGLLVALGTLVVGILRYVP